MTTGIQSAKFSSDRFGQFQLQRGNNIMAFVNEYVSEEDIKKYGLEAIDKRYFRAHYQTEWTRDKERDIYLRFMRDGGEDGMWRQKFTFYWKEMLMEVGLDHVGGSGERGAKGAVEWSLRYLSIPETLLASREQILADLREALSVYGGGGVYSSYTECTVTFDF